ncbi:DUF819 family protein [Saprospiraceae bacterium]|nr:DUF819 family protein [Saprospiraceae bacterium]
MLRIAPVFTNDAITLGILIVSLALIFHTASLESKGWKKFYSIIPSLLLAYFIPAFLNWPLGLIAPHWYTDGLYDILANYNLTLPSGLSYDEITNFLRDNNVPKDEFKSVQGHSQLYFVASRYLLPASLILFCIGIDFKGIRNLGPKAIIMFLAATLGIIIGGPIALLLVSWISPDMIGGSADDIWRGFATVAGSWIGGGANQTAMKEIYEVKDNLFGTMIVIDVVVANIWMGFLLYGANKSDKIDKWLKADNSAIEDLKNRVADYRASIAEMPTTTKLFVLFGFAFGGVALSHFGADILTPFMKGFSDTLSRLRLDSLMSHFFWLIVISTTFGMLLSLTKARKLEGVGASRWGSIFIYILVATIGMKMNLGEVFNNLGLFAVGITWMLVHVIILLVVAKLIKAPFFFVAVGSQANIGGAASAPIVASAFNPSLAPVGVLMAVLGYALGTYGAIICATLMQMVSNG